MRRERSQQTPGSGTQDRRTTDRTHGTLFVVGVPIGHPEDMTSRALSTLRNADVVASENPATTQTLFRHHGIHATITSYGPGGIREKVAVLIQRLLNGTSVALVSDCGSPVISDPGSRLISAAHAHAIGVVSVPGPSALTAAVAAAGLPHQSWVFGGQLPHSKAALARRLTALLRETRPTVFFCSAAGLSSAVTLIARRAPTRRLTLACNLTMPDEHTRRGPALRIAELIQNSPPKTAVTLIVEGRQSKTSRRARNRRPS